MRPATALIMVIETQWEFGRALGVAVWVVFVWAVICAVVYIIHAYSLPTMRFPRLQHNGEILSTGTVHCALEEMITGVVSIVSFRTLDSRTVVLRLKTNKLRSIDQAVTDENEDFFPIFPINCPPGSHIALKLGEVIREFTPIYSGNNTNEIEIVVRLVLNGAFSSVLLSLLGLDLHGSLRTEWTDCFLECGVYGPMMPLPAKFGYRPYYSPVKTCSSDSLRPTLIMIGAGSGAMPLFSVIAAALKNKDDRTMIKLLTLSGSSEDIKGSGQGSSSDFGTFIEDSIYHLQVSSKRLTASDPAEKSRFEGINYRKRFQTSMLDSWVHDPIDSVRTGAASAQSAATDRMIVWVCGPPGFGVDCRAALIATKGFLREQIFVLGVDDR